ncbi:hypothetical protein SPHINGOAX6_70694 [Sphingomonas sp. AX6]|nr:hypothetical protein SPHINGOAX6_70694 [Sphingomonas sp. AX6]
MRRQAKRRRAVSDTPPFAGVSLPLVEDRAADDGTDQAACQRDQNGVVTRLNPLIPARRGIDTAIGIAAIVDRTVVRCVTLVETLAALPLAIGPLVLAIRALILTDRTIVLTGCPIIGAVVVLNDLTLLIAVAAIDDDGGVRTLPDHGATLRIGGCRKREDRSGDGCDG